MSICPKVTHPGSNPVGSSVSISMLRAINQKITLQHNFHHFCRSLISETIWACCWSLQLVTMDVCPWIMMVYIHRKGSLSSFWNLFSDKALPTLYHISSKPLGRFIHSTITVSSPCDIVHVANYCFVDEIIPAAWIVVHYFPLCSAKLLFNLKYFLIMTH
jgi:hypothetical protein